MSENEATLSRPDGPVDTATQFQSLLARKRDRGELDPEGISFLVREYTASHISDAPMAAFLMAVLLNGLTIEETRALTRAMLASGDVLRFPRDARPIVDKHSTGGIGDKVSLPLAPLLAALGFRVPMLSGRTLGISGGTVDKMESIPGLSATLEADRIVAQVQEVGCVITAQTDRIAPADKAIYALRDVTGTVPSIPLITASILSKKLAESLDALVLDVKFGTAAFMRTLPQARELAESMTVLGRECGVNTRAILSGMSTPLGRAAGNWLEVRESVACLAGGGPQDLRGLVIELAGHLLQQTGRVTSLADGCAQAAACLASGLPREKWDAMLAAQGADLDAFGRQLANDHLAPVVRELRSDRTGFVSRCDALVIGEVIRELGGGRFAKDAAVDHRVGIDELAKPGEAVRAGDLLVRIHAATASAASVASARLRAAFAVEEAPPVSSALVQGVV